MLYFLLLITPLLAAVTCPNGKVYEANCYYFVRNTEALNWQQSEDYCNRDGGHLAPVNDDRLNKFLVQLTESKLSDSRRDWEVAIGAKVQDGNLLTSTGEELHFSKLYGNSDGFVYLSKHNGNWLVQDSDFKGGDGFICRFDFSKSSLPNSLQRDHY